ncbi:MAG: hypothetical protein Q3M24_16130 [Candidatus Electrothrix aestuarii]|uniref:Outer membrane lipoprotein-sorting protein n=1 Tax=Candidatus Electrothrix aestuarii TaxID=3062594 RepID=A0AAU8LRA1_9BACT|nr:hypothetical protein [Candidatus Electrothrix aestuarii]
MVELSKYFWDRSGENVPRDVVPEFTEWMFYKTHRVTTGKMAVSEMNEAPDGITVQIENGIYEFYIRGVAYENDKRISRVRFVKKGSSPVLGEKIGETYSDLAQNSFYEPDLLLNFFNEDDEKYQDWIEDIMFSYEGVFYVTTHEEKKDIKFYRFEAGFGDGEFDVYKLKEDEHTVGFEIEFIKDDEPYIFWEDVVQEE